MIDLSHNNLSGAIPSCLINIAFNTIDGKSRVSSTLKEISYSMVSSLSNAMKPVELRESNMIEEVLFDEKDEIEFTTKNRSYAYKGIDLNSCEPLISRAID